ncbi:hypothetical protein ACN28S_63735 [Cystobacter fuscus]
MPKGSGAEAMANMLSPSSGSDRRTYCPGIRWCPTRGVPEMSRTSSVRSSAAGSTAATVVGCQSFM